MEQEKLIYNIVFLFSSLASTYAIYLFSRGLFGEYQKSKKLKYISYGSYYVLSIAVYFLSGLPWFNVLLNVVMGFVLSFGYASRLRNRILYVVLLLAFLMSTDLVAVAVSGLHQLNIWKRVEYSSIFALIFVSLIMLLIARIICIFSRQKSEIQMPAKIWIYMIFITVSTVFISLVLISVDISYLMLSVSLTFLLLINCAVFYLFDAITKQMNQITELELMEKQNALYQHEFVLMQENEKQLGIIRHDMKNQLIHLQGMLQDKEYERTSEYVAELIGNVKSRAGIQTGNKIIDCILNYKLQLMNTGSIVFIHDVEIPEHLEVKEMDLVSLLGNLLDNAIEASLSEREGMRKIDLKISYRCNVLSICLKNICTSLPDRVQLESLKTSKQDKKQHGKGLLSVKQIVDKYDGNLVVCKKVEKEQEYFSITCSLVCSQ